MNIISKKKFLSCILFLSIFIISCSNNNPNQYDHILTSNYTFPSWLSDCNRFQTLFLQEFNKYPQLKITFDLPMIYALAYHESLCYTSEELHQYFKENNIKDDGWKGGVMQVDACWRGDQLLDCSTVNLQIQHGFTQLNLSFSQITHALHEYNINNLSNREKIALLLMSYNRGYYTVLDGIKIQSIKQKTGSFEIENRTKIINNTLHVYVNCVEKGVCKNDTQWIPISREIDLFDTDLQKSLIIACKSYFGTMSTIQGDYCVGKGYGLRYAGDVFRTYDEIIEFNRNVSETRKLQ